MNDTSQYPLNNPPSDGISEVRFSPYDRDVLLVASWDGVSCSSSSISLLSSFHSLTLCLFFYIFLQTLRLYNVENNELLESFQNNHAILTCCFGEKNKVYFGGLDSEVFQ